LLFYGVDQNIQDKDGQTALIKGIYLNKILRATFLKRKEYSFKKWK
jgi:hypothetical protein